MELFFAFHLCYRGQSPSEAERNYLDNARNLALYGVHMHDAKVTLRCILSLLAIHSKIVAAADIKFLQKRFNFEFLC